MVETVVSMGLPINENLLIQRNRILPIDGNENRGRISIVTGAHGDELEGQFVCYEVIRKIKKNPEKLKGIVDIYPAMNPLGLDSGYRAVPKIDMDLNRMFPGNIHGTMMEKVTAGIVDAIIGSDICIDVHASDTFVKEIPQVRISDEFEKMMLPYAKDLNVDLIWVNATATVHESTLAYSLCKLGVPALVMEMGLGNRINRDFGLQVTDGIFYLMQQMGIWDGEVKETKKPLLVDNDCIEFIRSPESGIFLPSIENNRKVKVGDKIGDVIDVIQGNVLCEIRAQSDGLVFTLREHPLVYEGALLARIIFQTREEIN